MKPDPTGPGQESIWDYRRPAIAEATAARIVIEHACTIAADTCASVRTLETSHSPSYHIPACDIAPGVLRRAEGSSFCEWKGAAVYWDLDLGDIVLPRVGWRYPNPMRTFVMLRDYVALYPPTLDRLQRGW